MVIHNREFFTKESVEFRAEKYGFSDPLPLELFLWDMEIAAHIQRESDTIVLKGGAAAQLHLPTELQRGSVDVDLIGSVDKGEIEEMVKKVESDLNDVKFRPHSPSAPTVSVPLSTYYVEVPSIIPREDRENLEIKAEILMEDVKLPTVTVDEVETFALRTSQLRCYGPHVLIGDKMLTLAQKTVGMIRSEDYPKQIYDIVWLLSTHGIDEDGFREIMEAADVLTPIEVGYRGMDVGVSEVMDDIQETMEAYAAIDTGIADRSVKREVSNFQQFLVASSQRRPWHEWSSRSLQIRFVASLLAHVERGQISPSEASDMLSKTLEMSEALGRIPGAEVGRIRVELMGLLERRIPYFRELRGKPLPRVFWEVVNTKNVERIGGLLP